MGGGEGGNRLHRGVFQIASSKANRDDLKMKLRVQLDGWMWRSSREAFEEDRARARRAG